MARIIAAAIMKDGRIYAGHRHYNVIRNNRPIDFKNCEQGFVDEDGNFLSRKEAAKIAYKNGQIKKKKEILFSEDLY